MYIHRKVLIRHKATEVKRPLNGTYGIASFVKKKHKNILNLCFRWDGNHTDLRVPNFGLPDVKHVPSKIGSLENMKHKPGFI